MIKLQAKFILFLRNCYYSGHFPRRFEFDIKSTLYDHLLRNITNIISLSNLRNTNVKFNIIQRN
jgi:hypothetical protein